MLKKGGAWAGEVKEVAAALLSADSKTPLCRLFNLPEYHELHVEVGSALTSQKEELTRAGLAKDDLRLMCVCGLLDFRKAFCSKLLSSLHERGSSFIALDTSGAYSGLIREVKDTKVFQLGVNYALNIFKPIGDCENYALVLTDVLKSVLNMDDAQARYLLRALSRTYEGGIESPSAEDLLDALLAVEAEITSREVYKLESLKMLLDSLQMGFAGRAFNATPPLDFEEALKPPAVLDMSKVYSIRFKTLAQAVSLVKLAFSRVKECCLLIEDAQHLLPNIQRAMRQDLALVYERTPSILQIFDLLNRRGVGVVLACSSPTEVSREVLSRAKSKVFFRSSSEADVALMSRMFSLSTEEIRAYTSLSADECLMVTSKNPLPVLVKLDAMEQEEVGDEELERHMEELGYARERLRLVVLKRGLLERLFKDGGRVVQAYKLLDLIKSSRIPHGGYRALPFIDEQEFRRIIKVLLRHKLITDYYDRDGVRWYAITSFGEDVLSDFEERMRGVGRSVSEGGGKDGGGA